MRTLPSTLLAAALLAGCLGGGAENRESTSGEATNPADDCLPGTDRGAAGSDDDASQGGGRDACHLPETADESRGTGV